MKAGHPAWDPFHSDASASRLRWRRRDWSSGALTHPSYPPFFSSSRPRTSRSEASQGSLNSKRIFIFSLFCRAQTNRVIRHNGLKGGRRGAELIFDGRWGTNSMAWVCREDKPTVMKKLCRRGSFYLLRLWKVRVWRSEQGCCCTNLLLFYFRADSMHPVHQLGRDNRSILHMNVFPNQLPIRWR